MDNGGRFLFSSYVLLSIMRGLWSPPIASKNNCDRTEDSIKGTALTLFRESKASLDGFEEHLNTPTAAIQRNNLFA